MKINCDILHVVEALENGRKMAEEGRLDVWDSDCIMKGISTAEMESRNIPRRVDDSICTIQWDRTSIGAMKFHQSEMTSPLELNPANPHAIDPKQASEPKELGERIGIVQKQLDYAYDAIWDLTEVNAASIARGGFPTDYELEYEFSMK